MIVALAVATFSMRLSFLALWAHGNLPSWLTRALAYVPAAAMAAIVAPIVFPAAIGLAESLPSFDLPRLIAAAAAFVIAYFTRSTLLTIVLGMATLWGVQALLGVL